MNEQAEIAGAGERARPRARLTVYFWLATDAAIATIVGSLMPWVTWDGGDRSGTDADGVITLVLAAIALLALFAHLLRRTERLLNVSAVAALIALAVAIYNVFDINSDDFELLGGPITDVSVGWGLWLTVGASALLLVTSLIAAGRAGRAGEQAPSRETPASPAP